MRKAGRRRRRSRAETRPLRRSRAPLPAVVLPCLSDSGDVEPPRVPARRASEHDAGRQRKADGEREHAEIESARRPIRDVPGGAISVTSRRWRARPTARPAAVPRRARRMLGQELAHDPAGAGSGIALCVAISRCRRAAWAGRSAGDVGAGDCQQEPDRCRQQKKHRRHVPGPRISGAGRRWLPAHDSSRDIARRGLPAETTSSRPAPGRR